MARPPRGRSIVLALAGVVLLHGVWAALSWRTLAVRYHAWRASQDVELLLAYSRQPDGSLRQLGAIHEMERSPRARVVLLDDYVGKVLEGLLQSFRSQLPLAERCVALEITPGDGQPAILWTSMEDSISRRLDHFDHILPGPRSTVRRDPPKRLPGLLERLAGESLRLSSFPDITISVESRRGQAVIRLESEILRPELAPLHRARAHPREEVRSYAARTLGSRFPGTGQAAAAAGQLVEALRDPASGVRGAAVAALIRLGAAGQPHLLAELRRADSAARWPIVTAYVGRPSLAAVPALIELLDEPADDLQSGALLALERAVAARGRAIATRAIREVSPRIRDTARGPRFRARACRTLAAIDPTGATSLPNLLEATGDPEPAVAAAAVDGLGDLGLAAHPAAMRVARALASPAPEVRLAAARALPRMAGDQPASLAASIAPLLLHQDVEVVGTALSALHGLQVAPPGSCPGLVRALERVALSEKGQAVRLLGMLGEDCEAAGLALKAAGEHPVLEKDAAEALRQLRERTGRRASAAEAR